MKEIERKFLVKDILVIEGCKFDQIQQTYLFNEPNKSLRVRIKNEFAFLTIKGNQIGITRDEFEYEIPKGEALEIIEKFDLKVLSKKRHYLNFGDLTWEIDVFEGKLSGLIVAEIEIPSENFEFEIPSWIGEEVTYDSSYLNAELFKKL
ncbi:MAG: CYTH domain-containing protein [Crocinitomicaceae bacterium]|jgi:CYTH domain-containing protein